MNKPIVVITGADSPTGLIAARSLKDYPVECWGVADSLVEPSCFSRYWKYINELTGTEINKINQLIRIAKAALLISGVKPLLIFSQDEWVLIANKYRFTLGEHYTIVFPDSEQLMILMDKTEFHKWAENNNYQVPESIVVTNYNELMDAVTLFNLPFIIKPLVRTKEWGEYFKNDKFIKITEKLLDKDLRNKFRNIFKLSERYLIQNWIPGVDDDVYFCLFSVSQNNEILDLFVGRKIWQWPPLGGSTAICTDYNSDYLRSVTTSLIADLKIKGLGSIEFKHNKKTDKYLITEPTVGRNDYQSFVAVDAGHNMTGRLVESVFKVSCEHNVQDAGVLWFDELAVFRRAKFVKNGFFILAKYYILNYSKKNIFLIFDFNDKGPIKSLVKNLLFLNKS